MGKRLNLHTWRPAVYILIEGIGTGDGSVEANHQRYYRRVLGDKRDKHRKDKPPNYYAMGLKTTPIACTIYV